MASFCYQHVPPSGLTHRQCAIRAPISVRRRQQAAKVAAVTVTKGAASVALHHIAPDGFSSAWMLPNVPHGQRYARLRSALQGLQQHLDKALSGSSSERVEGSLAAAALCITVHRAWCKEANVADHNKQDTQQRLPTAATNQERAARFVRRATEQASNILLSVANSNNSKPDIAWDAFPANLQQQLLELFQHNSWVNALGFPALQKQLPYEQPMGLQQYHTFISNNPYFMADWDEDYWVDAITPTPAQFPWLHPAQLRQALTEDQVLTMSAHIPAFSAVLQAAVDASILTPQLLRRARKAAAEPPLRLSEMFLRAGAAVSAQASRLISFNRRDTALTAHLSVKQESKARRGVDAAIPSPVIDTSGAGSSGGRMLGAIAAVGAGDDGGGQTGLAVSVLVGDTSAQQQQQQQQQQQSDVYCESAGPDSLTADASVTEQH